MSNRYITPGALRSVLLAPLAAWLLTAGGCAQMGFPELPQASKTPPATDAAADNNEPATSAATVADTDAPQPKPGQLYDWTGDGRAVTRIVIDTDTQLASFYAGDERVGWTTIATGVSSHPTPRGEFTIIEKVRDKRSNLYGKLVRNGKVIRGSAHGRDPVPEGARFVGASMPHFMRLTYDGIGMHAGPIPNPGQPASHGCIRMPPQMAEAVFAHVGPSTAVTVVGNGPDYGNYGERVARQRAEARARRLAEERARRAEEAAAAAQAPQRQRRPAIATAGGADAPSAAVAASDRASTAAAATATVMPGAEAQGGPQRAPRAGSPGAQPESPMGSVAEQQPAQARTGSDPDIADSASTGTGIGAVGDSRPETSTAAQVAGAATVADDTAPGSNAAPAPGSTSGVDVSRPSGTGPNGARPGRGDTDTGTDTSTATVPARASTGADTSQPGPGAEPDIQPPATPAPAPAPPAAAPTQPANAEGASPPPPPPTLRAAGDEPAPAPSQL
ncbi:L,D-transpeptidase family protein [uncultured Thiohalocapsa sp.]|uniref:L,D-transpeptidase family protein n=1 Tax=uncultured Thiohalocapsa sp. TaxID=768990 RepID=UPI0025F8BB8A|nr:L,D-transpeptidase family protein [uncultured Thiohalocapsa sp.]